MTDTKTMGIRSSFQVDTKCLANALIYSIDTEDVKADQDMPRFLSKIHRTSRRKLLISVKELARVGGQKALESNEWEVAASAAWPAAVAHASALVPELANA